MKFLITYCDGISKSLKKKKNTESLPSVFFPIQWCTGWWSSGSQRYGGCLKQNVNVILWALRLVAGQGEGGRAGNRKALSTENGEKCCQVSPPPSDKKASHRHLKKTSSQGLS